MMTEASTSAGWNISIFCILIRKSDGVCASHVAKIRCTRLAPDRRCVDRIRVLAVRLMKEVDSRRVYTVAKLRAVVIRHSGFDEMFSLTHWDVMHMVVGKPIDDLRMFRQYALEEVAMIEKKWTRKYRDQQRELANLMMEMIGEWISLGKNHGAVVGLVRRHGRAGCVVAKIIGNLSI